jgi:uroporphyrinogen III methyltransferase/synthase
MRDLLVPGQRVLIPRAESARAELITGLETLGAKVDEIPVYRAAVPSDSPSEALADLRVGRIDIVTFTSSSTVRNMVEMLGDATALEKPLIACIGPITADTARELGLHVDITAAEYTVEGLVEALKDHFA